MLLDALKEALSAMRRSKLMAFTTTATLTAFMFLLGIFLLAYTNLNAVVAKVKERVQIEAFLDDSVDRAKALSLAESITSRFSALAVSYIDKDAALEIFRQQFGDETLDALQFNPLPASLKIELREEDRTFSRVEQIARQIAEIPGVTDVEYGRRWLARLDSLLSTVAVITVGLGLVLGISAVLVVASTIKLAFHARGEAVEIMHLVGADPGFIVRPFVVEGAIYGFLGSLAASVLLALLLAILSTRLSGLRFLPSGLLFALLLLGAALGGLGSLFSLGRARRR